ncbi:putative enoyl reductase [Escovopsis weberi]|uniref:very-long-chain enoyl-CoA reductase n=1 Tax=Escovopsis weberi TaxID=150374 RepID=A0A0M8N8H4_ESCWE|nr:putative enoyl reductase [Escovopsis weberi]
MASQLTISVANRSPKHPIKKLPASVSLPEAATVDDLKQAIAKQAGISDLNRVGLFDPVAKKILKDRKALVSDEKAVFEAGQVLVKDLGYQVRWRTVFFVEYLGPLLIHAAVVAARPYIYADGSKPMSHTQWLTFGMIVAHFVKREIETLFVHKFSANTMPVWNIFRNSGYYWFFSGAVCAFSIYAPWSLAAKADNLAVDAVATALYLFGEIANALVHLYLASLRSSGGTERKIPRGYGFGLVTCPNYMYEILAWLAIIMASRDWSVALFITIGTVQMYIWGKGKEKAYRQEFGDKYKKKRCVLFPGLL